MKTSINMWHPVMMVLCLWIHSVTSTAPVTTAPSVATTMKPSPVPVKAPTRNPNKFAPTYPPTKKPSYAPSFQPTSRPTSRPTARPTSHPTPKPTPAPSLPGATNPPVGPPTQKPSMASAAAGAAGAAPVVLNGGAIAGIVIGGLVLILICVLVYRYQRAKKLKGMTVQKYDAGDTEVQGDETINPIQQSESPEIDPYLAQPTAGTGYSNNY